MSALSALGAPGALSQQKMSTELNEAVAAMMEAENPDRDLESIERRDDEIGLARYAELPDADKAAHDAETRQAKNQFVQEGLARHDTLRKRDKDVSRKNARVLGSTAQTSSEMSADERAKFQSETSPSGAKEHDGQIIGLRWAEEGFNPNEVETLVTNSEWKPSTRLSKGATVHFFTKEGGAKRGGFTAHEATGKGAPETIRILAELEPRTPISVSCSLLQIPFPSVNYTI